MNMYGTQPGWWHDPAMYEQKWYDPRGQLVGAITDEAFACAGVGARDIPVMN